VLREIVAARINLVFCLLTAVPPRSLRWETIAALRPTRSFLWTDKRREAREGVT